MGREGRREGKLGEFRTGKRREEPKSGILGKNLDALFTGEKPSRMFARDFLASNKGSFLGERDEERGNSLNVVGRRNGVSFGKFFGEQG